MKQDIIIIFDTSLSCTNLGNEIIMEAVYYYIFELIKKIDRNFYIIKIPIFTKLTNKLRNIIKNAKLIILGGTNIFHFYFLPIYRCKWGIDILDISYLNNKVLLFGVGTTIYNDNQILYKKVLRKIQELYSKYLWKKILIKDEFLFHSVRDSESVKLFTKKLRMNNVLNTGCPSLWKLDKNKIMDLKLKKSDKVVFTLTDYNKNYERDLLILKILIKHYKKIFFWPQGLRDLQYLKELIDEISLKNFNFKINIIPSSLKEYDNFLENNEVDYIGTRLHAGIRALQKNKKTHIICIDNRIYFFKKDFNLPIIKIEKLVEEIYKNYTINIKLNKEKIRRFLNNLKNFLQYD